MTPNFAAVRRGALLVAAVAAAVAIVGAFVAPRALFPAYLAGYLFALQVPLGALGLLLIDHLVGGAWSAGIRRPLEAAVSTWPYLAALFVPVVLGLPWLFAWAGPGAASDPVLAHQASYFNAFFFVGRAALYFACWAGLARAIVRQGAALETAMTPDRHARLTNLAAGGLVAYVITGSFAAIDWGMALEPRWTSTIYPLMLLVGAGLVALATGIVTMAWRARRRPVLPERTWQDLGNMLLTLLMTWAYLAFSQYLIIWAADRPGENAWYLHRTAGGWGAVALALLALHALLPFAVLLSRRLKRSALALAAVAGWVVAMHALEAAWLVWPSFAGPGPAWWLFAVAPWAPVGLWLWAYLGAVASRPLTPPPHEAWKEGALDG